MMRRWLAARHIPLVPLGWLILRYVEAVIGHRFATIAPVNCLRELRMPVLIAHGRHDTVIPPMDAEALVAAGDPATTTHIRLEGGHDPREALNDQWPALVDFLDRVRAYRTGIATGPGRGQDPDDQKC
jgi:fermentation-respiration switch protein FrsA (DUF1100 family)